MDFSLTPSPLTVTFPVNSADGATQCVDISITDDNALESDHDFEVSLANPSMGSVIAAQSTATATIIDNGTPLH